MKGDNQQLLKPAKEVRKACLKASGEGYKEAFRSGLCSEKALEAAGGAIQSLDILRLVKEEL